MPEQRQAGSNRGARSSRRRLALPPEVEPNRQPPGRDRIPKKSGPCSEVAFREYAWFRRSGFPGAGAGLAPGARDNFRRSGVVGVATAAASVSVVGDGGPGGGSHDCRRTVGLPLPDRRRFRTTAPWPRSAGYRSSCVYPPPRRRNRRNDAPTSGRKTIRMCSASSIMAWPFSKGIARWYSWGGTPQENYGAQWSNAPPTRAKHIRSRFTGSIRTGEHEIAAPGGAQRLLTQPKPRVWVLARAPGWPYSRLTWPQPPNRCRLRPCADGGEAGRDAR